jgi:hypothetical protein
VTALTKQEVLTPLRYCLVAGSRVVALLLVGKPPAVAGPSGYHPVESPPHRVGPSRQTRNHFAGGTIIHTQHDEEIRKI